MLAAEKFTTLLKRDKITSFTDNDIIFLDHVVTDQTFRTPDRLSHLESKLNLLIKNIYDLVTNKQALPYIIILESAMCLFHFTNTENYQIKSVYNKIANKYNIPLVMEFCKVILQFMII